MSRADHPIAGARRPPGRWLLGGLALAVVLIVAVALLAGGSSDDPELTVTNGAAAAGFPLRGNLARDTAGIRAAADAWLAHDARADDDSRVLDHDDDVEMRALWAVPGKQTFSPPAYQRLVAATTPRADGKNAQWDPNFDPPQLRLVQDRPLSVLGPTMVLTAESPSGRDRVLGRGRVLAAHGGSVAGKDEAEQLGLGDGRRDGDNAAYGEDGPALAAAIVDRGTRQQPNRDLAVFVAGSSQIETIEMLTGREHLTRPGPVAVVPLPESTDDGPRKTRPRGDLAVLGRTRAGTVVVPSKVIDG